MSFFIPEGAQWNALARDATKQRVIAGATLAAGLTGLSRMAYAYGPRFKRRRLNPRKVRGRKFNRGMAAVKRFRANKGITSGRGVTFEHDRQFIYKKKRMPRRRRRRWVGFVRKVNAVDERDLGTRTVLFNKSQSSTNQTAQEQLAYGICLYGWSSTFTGASWNNDLAYIMQLENQTLDPTAAIGDVVSDDTKIMFQSGVLDITMRNVSYLSNDPTNLSSEATLETDVYEISMRKVSEVQGLNYNSLDSILKHATASTAGIYNQTTAAQGTAITLKQRGSTPFEMTKALSMWGIKVLKKTKFFIRNGQTVTFQLRDPKRRVSFKTKLADSTTAATGQNGFNKPGWTKHVLVVAKAVPGVAIGTGADQTSESIQFGVTRKYSYKLEGVKEARSIYVNR